MKICAISDLHGNLPRVPPCDLLIISGDVAPDFEHPFAPGNGYKQIAWLNSTFKQWLHTVQAEKVVATAGNHDFGIWRLRTALDADLRWELLINEATEYRGVKIWGAPYVKDLPGWAFSLFEHQLEERWARIPADTDILVLHGPPHEVGDWVQDSGGFHGYLHTGSVTLLNRIDAIAPRLVTFGHIHEAKGEWQRGKTTLVNASVLNDEYRLCYKPWVQTIDFQTRVDAKSDTLEV